MANRGARLCTRQPGLNTRPPAWLWSGIVDGVAEAAKNFAPHIVDYSSHRVLILERLAMERPAYAEPVPQCREVSARAHAQDLALEIRRMELEMG